VVQSIKFGFEFICPPRHFLRFMACHRSDTTNAFRNAGLFGDDKILDVARLCNMTERYLNNLEMNDGIEKKTYVPPQNSTLVLRHLGFSMSFDISSTSYSRVTTRTGSGYDSPKTALRPAIFCAV
jgi:hypothetical protein